MNSSEVVSFAQLGLSDAVLRAVYDVGYETPSPIQAATIPPLLEGRDLLGQAQTGTGKTAAFALPLLSRLDLNRARTQVLVLTPTRELAIQVAEALQTYARYLTGFHVLPVYGGQSLALQLRPLRRGVHAVVGTPGRILDHLRRRTLSLEDVRTVVLDEADEMLRMGFIDDVAEILDKAPEQKQLALFSATMPDRVRTIARQHTRDPVEIRIKSRTATVSTVSQRYWQVGGVHKLDALTRLLEVEDFDAMVIFVRTKIATSELSDRLEARGLAAAPLNGDMNQATRELTIDRLKSGRLDILVATDVAARGLDVERISHVLNYDIPYDTEAYVHRIGRTARAGRKGEAILFVAPRERRMLRAIEHATGQRIAPMTIPSREDVVDKRTQRFKAAISDVIASQDLSLYQSVIASYQAEHNVGLNEIAAALAHMAQGDKPLIAAQSEDQRRPRREPKERKETRGKQHVEEREERKQASPSPRIKQPKRDTASADRDGKRQRTANGPREDFVRYRIEAGAAHGVAPGNIVGAIANEAGLDSENISGVTVHDDYSTVDLPSGMPKDIYKHLRRAWVCGRRMKLSVLATGDAPAGEKPKKPSPRHAKQRSKGEPRKDKPKKRAKHEKQRGKR